MIEVKYRKNNIFGGGFDAINFDKQKRLGRAFEYWLSENHQYSDLQPRIDVISVNESGKIEYIENAI